MMSGQRILRKCSGRGTHDLVHRLDSSYPGVRLHDLAGPLPPKDDASAAVTAMHTAGKYSKICAVKHAGLDAREYLVRAWLRARDFMQFAPVRA